MRKLNFLSNAEFSAELTEKVSYDEATINILLSVSPKKIVLHECKTNDRTKEIKSTLEIIKKIFEGKIEYCKGCKYCELL